MNCRIILLIAIIGVIISCNERYRDVRNCGENPSGYNLLVFIGEKISVKELTDEKDIMDAKFLARYKILEKVCGNYNKDTIEFIVYDHYGPPAFEEFKTVMLYVSEEGGKFYHEKYQFQDVYKTKDGRWASPYDWLDNPGQDTFVDPIKPEKLDFAQEVSFDITGFKPRRIKDQYPRPFYKIVGTKAIAIYGNYVPELFELKKRGVLGARGLFGNVKNDSGTVSEVTIEDVVLSDAVKLSKNDIRELTSKWKELYTAVVNKDIHKVKQLSFDSVVCSVCEGFSEPSFYNDDEPIDSFITSFHLNISNTELWQVMKAGRFRLSATEYPSSDLKYLRLSPGERLTVYDVKFKSFALFGNSEYEFDHRFEFVKVNGEFKFKGMSSDCSSSRQVSSFLPCEQNVDMTQIFGVWRTASFSSASKKPNFSKMTFTKGGICHYDKIRDGVQKRISARFILQIKDSTIVIKTDKGWHRYKVLRLTQNCLEYQLKGQNSSMRYDRME